MTNYCELVPVLIQSLKKRKWWRWREERVPLTDIKAIILALFVVRGVNSHPCKHENRPPAPALVQ